MALDGGRATSLQSQLQKGADALATAGAAELDRAPNSTTRAVAAINNLVTNSSVFGTGGAANVTVSYTDSGLGFAARIGEPVPTVTVELTGLNFQLFCGLMGFADIVIPSMRTTITGEDLSSRASS